MFFIIAWQSFGYYCIFLLQQSQIKYAVKELIENAGASGEEFETLRFSKYNFNKFISKKEFYYQDHLYDIISVHQTEDETLVYCYRDDKEKALKESFINEEKNKNDFEGANQTEKSTKQIKKNYDLFFMELKKEANDSSQNSIRNIPEKNLYHTDFSFIIIPPPKILA